MPSQSLLSSREPNAKRFTGGGTVNTGTICLLLCEIEAFVIPRFLNVPSTDSSVTWKYAQVTSATPDFSLPTLVSPRGSPAQLDREEGYLVGVGIARTLRTRRPSIKLVRHPMGGLILCACPGIVTVEFRGCSPS